MKTRRSLVRLLPLSCALVCALGVAGGDGAEAAQGYMELHAKVKEADLCFAALVTGDCARMPSAPNLGGAHRLVTVRPLSALKGQLPAGPVGIRYSDAVREVGEDGAVTGWIPQHACRLFEPGAVYFFCANTAEGALVLRDAPECCFVLDDPLGGGRAQIAEAFRRAELALSADWQARLDAAVGKALPGFVPPFEQWVGEGDFVACLRVRATMMLRVEGDVPQAQIPRRLHDSLIADRDKPWPCFVARNWPGIGQAHVTWTKAGLPLAASLRKQGAKVSYALEATGTLLTESIPVDDRPIPSGDVAVTLAWSLEEPVLKEYADRLGTGRAITVPVKKAKDGGAYEACGQLLAPGPGNLAAVTCELRRLAARLRQRRFIDSLIRVRPLPARADMAVAGMLLGKTFAADGRGHDELSTYWWKIRPDFSAPLEMPNPAAGSGLLTRPTGNLTPRESDRKRIEAFLESSGVKIARGDASWETPFLGRWSGSPWVVDSHTFRIGNRKAVDLRVFFSEDGHFLRAESRKTVQDPYRHGVEASETWMKSASEVFVGIPEPGLEVTLAGLLGKVFARYDLSTVEEMDVNMVTVRRHPLLKEPDQDIAVVRIWGQENYLSIPASVGRLTNRIRIRVRVDGELLEADNCL